MNEIVNTDLSAMLGDKSWLFPGLKIVKDVKEGRAWRFEIPEIGDDLEFQIFFKARFSTLTVDKKIAKLVKEIETGLADNNFPGEFHIDVVPEVQAVIISQKNYWKDYRSKPDDFANLIEQACEKIL